MPEPSPRAAAALAAAAALRAASQQTPLGAPTAFADVAAYLELQFDRLRAGLERVLAAQAGDDEGAARWADREAALAKLLAERLALTAEPPALETLRAQVPLDDFDVDTLLHVLAATVDPAMLRLHARIGGGVQRGWLDVEAAIHCRLTGVAERLRARARFLPAGKLVSERLLLVDRSRPEARENLLACELKLPPRIARLLLGQEPTAALPHSNLVEPHESLDQVVLPDEVRDEVEMLVAGQPQLSARLRAWGLDRVVPSGGGVVVLLAGPPGTGKSTLARALARRLGKRLLVVDAARLLETARAIEEHVDELFQEARLSDAVVLFDECEALFSGRQSGNRAVGTLLRALDSFEGLAVLATNLPERLDAALDRRVLVRIALEVPPPSLRTRIWQMHLPPETPLADDVRLPVLAKRYDFSGGYIKNAVLLAVSRAIARSDGGVIPALTMGDLEQAAQAQLRGDLSQFAERTRGTLGLEALVLPADVKAQVEEVISAGRNRGQVLMGWGFNETIPTGKGLVVLLSGDPGTGKTLSAEVIAAELGMSLYRVNPAKVVSKYVGETEKNLNEVLAQAKSTHAILFFDEADALFAARVAKVESANDRFVNMETNFLLQQLERYEGLVILATNLETMIDQAFRRRIHYHIVIPFPDVAARERIWRGVMPGRAPLGADVDFARLARHYELSGGHIKNAALRAAYMAAQRAAPIDMRLLCEAAELECGNAGKLFQSRLDGKP